MHDTKQSFWEEFKAMMADPVQRQILVENFEKCKAEVQLKSKKMKIALLGTVEDFQKKIDWLNYSFPYSQLFLQVAFNMSSGFFEVGELQLVRVCKHDDAFGREFDACIWVGVPTFSTTEAAFYLAAHNTKKLSEDEFSTLLKAYFNQS